METVFLSYTYRSHPAHEADLDRLHRCVVRTLEPMGLRIIDGVDLGGRALDATLKTSIAEADALIALMTPQANAAGDVVSPNFVTGEFNFAQGKDKPTMRVLHHLLPNDGFGAGDEYTPYTPGAEIDVVLKLMRTIALWRRDYGRRARVRIEPRELAQQYDERDGYSCEFKVVSPGVFGDFQKALVSKEPGAAYALLPMLRQSDRIELRVRNAAKTWKTPGVIDPFVGGGLLEEQP